MWISNTATTLMMVPIALSAAAALKDESGRFVTALLLGVCYAASIGGVATPIGTPTNLIAIQWLEENTGTTIGYAQWMSFGLPALALLIPVAWWVVTRRLPQLGEVVGTMGVSRVVPAFGLYASRYLLIWSLTPKEYSLRRYPKWPGALFTALWWLAVTTAMPPVLRTFFSYDLVYGSLAGIMIALFFFWLVGRGVVIGAELNAALAEPETGPEDEEIDAQEYKKEDAA